MFDDEDGTYVVVVNDEEQYSIWPVGREIPNGWHQVGDPRLREACLTYIEQVWTDMRPKSVRRLIEAATGGGA